MDKLPPLLSIAFTGHREVEPEDEPAIDDGLDFLRDIGWDRPVVFHNGGADGFDTYVLKRIWPSLNSVEAIHVPFDYRLKALHKALNSGPNGAQPVEEWLHFISLCQAESCKPIPYNGHKWRFQERNQHMVDNADIVISYYNGTPGGTKNCIDYAIRTGKPVYDIRNLDAHIRERIKNTGWRGPLL